MIKINYSLQMLIVFFLLTTTSAFGYSNSTLALKNKSLTLEVNAYPSSLTNFNYEVNLGPSVNQTFTINDGLLLDRAYTVAAPSGYEVSTSSSSGFNPTIVIPGTVIDAGIVTVYVRLTSSLAINTYTGNLTITAPEITTPTSHAAVSETISLSGEVARKETTWNGTTWGNGSPDITTIAVINSNYDTATHGNLSAWEIQVSSGHQLTVNDNTFVEAEYNVIVDGTLQIDSSGSLVQNNDAGVFTLNSGGNASVIKNTSVLQNWYDYTYWSSPVNGITANDAFASSSYKYWFNAQNYLDILQETDNGNTYVAGHDDIDDNGDDWTNLNGSANLTPGVGYATTHSSSSFTTGNTYQYTFSGAFNTGTITTPVYYNGDNGDNDWNFIGNPYSSAISADAFFTENSALIGNAIYLWSHASDADNSNNGNEAYNFSRNDYAIINSGSGEVAGASTVIPDRYIPSGQGFFIQGMANGSITFNNAMRMKDNTSNDQFFRRNNNANKLWLNLTSDNGVFNQILVAYVEGATDGNDGSAYDSPRFLTSDTPAIIYTTIENEPDIKYAIQGKNPTGLNVWAVINVGFYTAIEEATIYTFSIPKKTGDFMNNNPIYVKDNLMNITHNLLDSDYTFTSATGTYENRFEIVFQNETLGVNDESYDNALTIREISENEIQFNANGNQHQIETIALYNMQGQLVYKTIINDNNTTLNIYNLSTGTYIAEVKLDNGKVVKKKMIKRL